MKKTGKRPAAGTQTSAGKKKTNAKKTKTAEPCPLPDCGGITHAKKRVRDKHVMLWESLNENEGGNRPASSRGPVKSKNRIKSDSDAQGVSSEVSISSLPESIDFPSLDSGDSVHMNNDEIDNTFIFDGQEFDEDGERLLTKATIPQVRISRDTNRNIKLALPYMNDNELAPCNENDVGDVPEVDEEGGSAVDGRQGEVSNEDSEEEKEEIEIEWNPEWMESDHARSPRFAGMNISDPEEVEVDVDERKPLHAHSCEEDEYRSFSSDPSLVSSVPVSNSPPDYDSQPSTPSDDSDPDNIFSVIQRDRDRLIDMHNYGDYLFRQKITRRGQKDFIHMTTRINSFNPFDSVLSKDEFKKKRKSDIIKLIAKICETDDFSMKCLPMCYNSCRGLTDNETTVVRNKNTRKNGIIQTEPCPECGSVETRKYYYYPIIIRLKRMIESPHSREKMLYRHKITQAYNRFQTRADTCRDIYDGSSYRKLLRAGLFESELDILVGIPHDGFTFLSAQDERAWLLCLYNYNLPPSERSKIENVLVVMMIPGPTYPKSTLSFMDPLLSELLELENGIECVLRTGNTNGPEKPGVFQGHVISSPSDIADSAWIVGLSGGSNSVAVCRYCMIVGTPLSKPGTRDVNGVRHTGHYYFPMRAPTDQSRDFKDKIRRNNADLFELSGLVNRRRAFEDLLVGMGEDGNRDVDLCNDFVREEILRTHDRHVELVELSKTDHPNSRQTMGRKNAFRKITGITTESKFFDLKSFQLCFPHIVPPDCMHYIMNVTKLMVEDVWPQYLKQGKDKEILVMLTKGSVVPGHCIWGRWPVGCFTGKGSPKAEEWISFTLFLTPILLKDAFVDDAHYRGWMNFVRMCRLVLGRESSLESIEEATEEAKQFMKYYEEKIYRRKESNLELCRYNSHFTSHIPQAYDSLSKLHTVWNFPIENMIGVLKRLIQSTVHVYAGMANVLEDMEILKDVRVRHDIKSLSTMRAIAERESQMESITFGDPGPGTRLPRCITAEMGAFRDGNEESVLTPGYFMAPRKLLANLSFEGDTKDARNLPIRKRHFMQLLFRYVRDRLEIAPPAGTTLREMIQGSRIIAYGKYVTTLNELEEPEEGITTTASFKESFVAGGNQSHVGLCCVKATSGIPTFGVCMLRGKETPQWWQWKTCPQLETWSSITARCCSTSP